MDSSRSFGLRLGLLAIMVAGCLAPAGEAVPTVSEPTPTAAPATPTPVPPTPTPVRVRTLTPTIAPVASNDDPPGTVVGAIPFEDRVGVDQAEIHAMELASECGSGSQSVWYAFRAVASEILVASTVGSDYDTILDIYRGSLSNDFFDPGFEMLDPLACSDNLDDGSVHSEIVFAAESGTDYVFRVSTGLNDVGGNLVFSIVPG